MYKFNKFILPTLTILVLVLATVGVFFPKVTFARTEVNPKINICHRTNSHTNPYVWPTGGVDDDSILYGANAHDGHNGPVWYPGIVGDWGDIIPSFDYYEFEKIQDEICPTNQSAYGFWFPGKTCERGYGINKRYAYPIQEEDWDYVRYTYPGKNLTIEGQAILDNHCEIPSCLYTIPAYSLWSKWMLDDVEIVEYRTRSVNDLDYFDHSITCDSYSEREEQPIPSCKYQTPENGDWSVWSLVPDDSTMEYRTRTITYKDTYTGEICGEILEDEKRPVDYCSETIQGDPVWSEWKINPEDETEEYREGYIPFFDASYPEYLCGSEPLDDETRDIVIEDEEEDESDEDDDKPTADTGDTGEAVKGESDVALTSSVVKAATGPSDNVMIYVLEMILVISTLASSYILSKKLITK